MKYSKLKQVRKDAGLTIREVAEELGITVGRLSCVEHGRDKLTTDQIAILEGPRLYNLSPGFLSGYSSGRPKSNKKNQFWVSCPTCGHDLRFSILSHIERTQVRCPIDKCGFNGELRQKVELI